ncbi:MAG: nitroreductase [Hyphomonadaceae bacterium]
MLSQHEEHTLAVSTWPTLPAEGDACAAAHESSEALAMLARRRSTKIVHLAEPGPTSAEIDKLIALATRVPDHGKLGPWRFVVIEGEARARAGEALAAITDEASAAAARLTFTRAPVCVMVVSTATAGGKIPEWEQQLSAGAACFALLLAAHTAGFGGCWLTGWACYDARARAALGLSEHERIAGFIHLGTATETPTERVRAGAAERISRF